MWVTIKSQPVLHRRPKSVKAHASLNNRAAWCIWKRDAILCSTDVVVGLTDRECLLSYEQTEGMFAAILKSRRAVKEPVR